MPSESVSNKWRQFQQLCWRERFVLAQALVLLPLNSLALRLVGFRRLQSALARLTPLAGSPVEESAERQIAQARIVARMVRAAAWYSPFRASCLLQSLTLWWLLRRQELASELRIGVRTEADRLEAHAWVEYRGVILNDRDDVHQRFTAFEGAIVPREQHLHERHRRHHHSGWHAR